MDLVTSEKFADWWRWLAQWANESLLSAATGWQLLVLLAGFALASLLVGPVRNLLASQKSGFLQRHALFSRGIDRFLSQFRFVVWLLVSFVAVEVAKAMGWPHQLLSIATSLLAAWVIIQIASGFIGNRALAGLFALFAWTVAALNILGWLQPVMQTLDRIAFQAGDFRFSLLMLGKAVLALGLLLWLAVVLSTFIERRLKDSNDLSPAMQVLLGKLVKLALIVIAILAGLGAVGIDITTLAIFTGALGFGIGFGMQKVVSNLVSGLILLLDKSIKPGDVITIGDTYGWVNSMGARYVSLVTRNGIEYLVPNEDLITQQVENWSYSNKLVRQEVIFGVSYHADIRLAMRLGIEAANETDRILTEPKPNCFIRGFGDSSVDLILRFWLHDPKDGVANLKGAVLLALWDKLHENNIEIPFPQRDLHLRSAEPLPVRLDDKDRAGI
ncbi:MAG TPA: mechanosensitive ion channel protein MscS [Alphaproteobacteria bacterium]|jgi:small-conductance mechanosensitive channel|nr:mechanosensitive ion channel protein MscS [Alphaproteobacteria bacterium]